MTLQNASIALQNIEQVTSFEYYDKENRTRVSGIKTVVIQQTEKLKKVEGELKKLKESIQKNDSLLKEYEMMQVEWKMEKQRIMDKAEKFNMDDENLAGDQQVEANKSKPAGKAKKKKGK